MRIIVAAVGRARRDPAAELFDHYRARLLVRGLGPLDLKEVEERRPLPPDERKIREAVLLLAAVPKGAVLVALDAAGQALSSEAFAERLAAWRDEGRPAAAFLIGGAGGLGQEALAKADMALSLGPMTWPHLLVRGLLAEQLYRAQSILSGHPYHRS